MKTILLVLALLLALYGLSRLLSRMILWLTRPEKGALLLLVPLFDDASVNTRLQSAREHLYAGGFADSVRMAAVDCGLSADRRQHAADVCRNWHVVLFYPEELANSVCGNSAGEHNKTHVR